MPHLAVIQLMRVIKWPRSDSDGSCVKINVRGNKGFYSIFGNGRKTKAVLWVSWCPSSSLVPHMTQVLMNLCKVEIQQAGKLPLSLGEHPCTRMLSTHWVPLLFLIWNLILMALCKGETQQASRQVDNALDYSVLEETPAPECYLLKTWILEHKESE